MDDRVFEQHHLGKDTTGLEREHDNTNIYTERRPTRLWKLQGDKTAKPLPQTIGEDHRTKNQRISHNQEKSVWISEREINHRTHVLPPNTAGKAQRTQQRAPYGVRGP